jgi:hypothetical protein
MTGPNGPSGDNPQVLAALRALPREEASPGFTAAVLERAAAPAAADGGWSRATLALAASLVLVTVLTAGALERAHQRRELRGRVDALRTEHDALQQELAQLKQLSAQEPAVVYLGGDESVDVVLSVDPKNRPASHAGAVVPVKTAGEPDGI